MAQKVETIVHLIDDIDGGEADKSFEYGWNGKTYAIDLSSKNSRVLEKVMADLIPHSRLVRTTKSGKPAFSVTTGPDPRAVRKWAEANNIEVNRLGKVPTAIVDQYLAAGN